MSLKLADVTMGPTFVVVAASKLKVTLREGLPSGRITFSRMPWLLALLARWISVRASFLTLFPRHGSPSATVSHALQSVASTYSL